MPIENFSSFQSSNSPEKREISKSSHEQRVETISQSILKQSPSNDPEKTLDGKKICDNTSIRLEVEAINDTVFFLSQNLDKAKYPKQVEALEVLSNNEPVLLPGVSILEIGEKYHQVKEEISWILKQMQYSDILELINIEPSDFLIRELHLAIPSLQNDTDSSSTSEVSSILSSVGRASSQQSLNLQSEQLLDVVDDFLAVGAIDEAWEVASSIPEDSSRDSGSAKVCRYLIKNNALDEAADYLDKMDESLIRDELLSETAIAYMKNILVQESVETAYKITDETRKSRTLSILSIDLAALSKGYEQIDESVKLANSIRNLQIRQETFGELAIQSVQNRELETARALIEQISDDEIKTKVLVELCTKEARSISKEVLFQFAAMIPDPVSRKSTVAKIEQINPRKTT